jgi:hypothetical protein
VATFPFLNGGGSRLAVALCCGGCSHSHRGKCANTVCRSPARSFRCIGRLAGQRNAMRAQRIGRGTALLRAGKARFLLAPYSSMQDVVQIVQDKFSRDTVHSTQSTVHSTQYTVHSTQYTVHSTQYTVHSTQYTVHSTQYTVHSTHYTLHTTHYTLHTTHYTLHTTHYTLHTTHYTLHSTQYAGTQVLQTLRDATAQQCTKRTAGFNQL